MIRPSVSRKGAERKGSLVRQRHVAYGVREEHYDTVGAALLWTLEQGLGDAWTVELATAWATAYTLLATTMKDAAAEIDAVAV